MAIRHMKVHAICCKLVNGVAGVNITLSLHGTTCVAVGADDAEKWRKKL